MAYAQQQLKIISTTSHTYKNKQKQLLSLSTYKQITIYRYIEYLIILIKSNMNAIHQDVKGIIQQDEIQKFIISSFRNEIMDLQDHELQDTNTHPIINVASVSQSDVIVATPEIIKIMKDTANKVFNIFNMAYGGDDGSKVFNELEMKARKRVMKLGLKGLQIDKLAEVELRVQNMEEVSQQKIGQTSKNLVYLQAKKKRVPKSKRKFIKKVV